MSVVRPQSTDKPRLVPRRRLEEPLPSASSTQQRRRKNEQSPPPLLALGFGPFSIPLLPPLPPRSPSPEPEPEVEPHGAAAVGPPSTSSVAGNSGGSPVERLWAALAQRDPHLAERLAGTGEALDAAALSRWLAARHGDIEAATAGIVAHAAWREVFVGSGSPGGISEASIARELAARKVFLQGCDAAGRPVVVVQAGRHDMGRRDLAETKSLIAYVLDSSCATADIARNPMGRICCLFDLSGELLQWWLLLPGWRAEHLSGFWAALPSCILPAGCVCVARQRHCRALCSSCREATHSPTPSHTP